MNEMYCYHCDREIIADVIIKPDCTIWSCPDCNCVLDSDYSCYEEETE